MENAILCKECGGRCCSQPLLNDSDIRRMISATSNQAVAMAGLHKEAQGWYRITGACPALTDLGCIMSEPERPLACRLYPFQIIMMPEGKYMVLLDVNQCPHWREFGEDYEGALEAVRDAITAQS